MPVRMMTGTAFSNAADSSTSTPAPTSSAPAALVLPTIDDPLVMKMRPDLKPIATLIIDPTGATAGSVPDFPAAVARIREEQQLAMSLANKTVADPTMRVDVGVVAGEHFQPDAAQKPNGDAYMAQEIPSYTAFYALNPTKGSTLYHWGLTPSGGGCHYWEGIDLRPPNTGAWEPKYPIHLSSFETNIFTRCTLQSDNSGAGGGLTAIGTDGYNGGSSFLHDVVMPAGGTNQHGEAELTVPNTIVYSKVVAPNGAIGWNALNDTCPDEVWFVDCQVSSCYTTGAAVNSHLSPSTVGALGRHPYDTTKTALTGTQDARTDWPVPVGGLMASTRAKYGLPAAS